MPFLFNIRVPCDAGFVDPVRELVDRVARYAGYEAPDARQIGEVAAAALARLPRSEENAELQFQTSDGNFELTLVLNGAVAETPSGFTCTRDGARTICRLERRLPGAVSD